MTINSHDPKKELIDSLHPFRRIVWVDNFIKKVQKPQIIMPKGTNAHTEKFLLGLALCFCLFMKNNASLMKHGQSLKNYTNKYAQQVPLSEQPLISQKLTELMNRLSK